MVDRSDTSPVKAGEILAGKYRVDRVLGVGGMGVVVAASHVQLGKKVAIKFMLPAGLAVPIAVERFLREARSAVQLRGEHVAQVLDVGNLDNGAPYMVMEFLEGNDLGDVIQGNGPLPIADAVDFVMQACEAVAEAHLAGIVHRDLKPRNLFLTRRIDHSPLVKVLDFGISKVVAREGEADHSLTRTSDVMGSPNYMSPEQIKSTRSVDGRSDIWSLGVVLYELLSGQVPFQADTMPQLCGLVLQDPPTPLLRDDMPPGLWAVILRCLEKSPEARFQNIAELTNALEPFAPSRSRIVLDRVRAMSRGSSPPSAAASSVAPPIPARTPAPLAPTTSSWVSTRGSGDNRGRRVRVIAALALSGALLASVGLWLTGKRSASPSSQSAASSEPAPIAVAVIDPSARPSATAITPAILSADAAAPSSASAFLPSTTPTPSVRAVTTPRTKPGADAAASALPTPGPTASSAPRPAGSAPREDVLSPHDRK